MAMFQSSKKGEGGKKFHPLSTTLPLEKRAVRCPVCRQDFTAPENQRAVKCPAKGCETYYHDWGDGHTCWDAIDKCARPGCKGKDFEKERNKKQKDKQSLLYLAKKMKSGQEVTHDEMALMAQLVKEHPEVELSPDILKRIIYYMRNTSYS